MEAARLRSQGGRQVAGRGHLQTCTGHRTPLGQGPPLFSGPTDSLPDPIAATSGLRTALTEVTLAIAAGPSTFPGLAVFFFNQRAIVPERWRDASSSSSMFLYRHLPTGCVESRPSSVHPLSLEPTDSETASGRLIDQATSRTNQSLVCIPARVSQSCDSVRPLSQRVEGARFEPCHASAICS